MESEKMLKMFVVMLRDKQTQNAEVITAVSSNCEICSKFTFYFRKIFYLNRKYAGTKFAAA